MSRDIIHTVPKSQHKSFDTYVKSITGSTHNYYHSHAKKPKVGPGSKAYIVHDGAVRGYIPITGFPIHSKTGMQSPHKTYNSGPGYYTPRSNRFIHQTPKPMKGFQGYRYKK